MMSLSCFRSKRSFAAGALLLVTVLAGCVSKACPDGQKLQSGKCVDKSGAAEHEGDDAAMPEPDDGLQDAAPASDAGISDAAMADADAAPCAQVQPLQCWQDGDRDGYAVADAPSMSMACETKCPIGWTDRQPVDDGIDCADDDAKVRPRGCWRDHDMDGYAGDAHEMTVFCAKECGSGWTTIEPKEDDIDCSDMSQFFHPKATETCNGKDNDCDGKVDEDTDATCVVKNGVGACVEAACTVGECTKGFGDCDGLIDNGCEQQFDTHDNCGACDVACDPFATCEATKTKHVGACACQVPAYGDGKTCHGPGPMAGGWRWTCAIDQDQMASCWGAATPATTIPDGKYLQIASGQTVGCGITTDKTLHCWGTTIGAGETKFIQVVAGNDYVCGLTVDHAAICWGYGSKPAAHGEANVPNQKFVQLAGGFFHVCGLGDDGTATCWGAGIHGADNCDTSAYDCGQSDPPAGEKYVELVAGTAHTCGLKEDGTPSCWGIGKPSVASPTELNYGQALPPGDVELRSLSAGSLHTCGIRKNNGNAVCWGAGKQGGMGSYDLNQSEPPGGGFVVLTGGWYHTCGLTTENEIVCWGNNVDGQAPSFVAGTWVPIPGQ